MLGGGQEAHGLLVEMLRERPQLREVGRAEGEAGLGRLEAVVGVVVTVVVLVTLGAPGLVLGQVRAVGQAAARLGCSGVT